MAGLRKSVTGLLTVALCVASAGSVAHAQDEWPQDPPGQTYSTIGEYTGRAITPDNPRFYDPEEWLPRILSPFGNKNKILCNGTVKGTVRDCYQADEFGNPHRLIKLENPFTLNPRADSIHIYPTLLGPLTQPVFAPSSIQYY